MVYSYNRITHYLGGAGKSRGLEVRIEVSLRGKRKYLSGSEKRLLGCWPSSTCRPWCLCGCLFSVINTVTDVSNTFINVCYTI